MKLEKVIQRGPWCPQSYKGFKQYIKYFEHDNPIFKKLAAQRPIVSIQKIQQSKKQIKQCEEGQASLLHIGDCAEPFEHAVDASILPQKIQFMKECQRILSQVKSKPTRIIGRIAGQYAKPRSSQFMHFNGAVIHNYKGDNVNNICESDRNPCQNKLFKGYEHSLKTMKLIEQLFPQLYTSHEGLILPYQQSFTKQKDGSFYCQSAHMLWIGERTRQMDGAHIEFFRGLANPVGIKISSSIKQQQFKQLIRTLNPQNEKGKLLVIVRMGKQKIKQNLEELIKIKQGEGFNFLFVTDPMHGNTTQTEQSKIKTRSIDHILSQTRYFEDRMAESKLGYGYSMEATFEDVTECYGIEEYPAEQHQVTRQRYASKCDPRLNRKQTYKFLAMLNPK